jgi:hypothetical protein
VYGRNGKLPVELFTSSRILRFAGNTVIERVPADVPTTVRVAGVSRAFQGEASRMKVYRD